MERTDARRKRQHKALAFTAVLGLAALALAFLASRGIAVPCLFHRLTGLLCPGCGNTRAAVALMRLELSAALSYNLFAPLEFFYIGWVYFFTAKHYIRTNRIAYRTPSIAFDICVLVVVVAWGIVRNLV